MSIHTKILMSFIAIYTLSSCHKSFEKSIEKEQLKNLSSRTMSLLETEDPDNNYVAIICSQTANLIDPTNSYDITAAAKFTSNGVTVNTGPVEINGRVINADADNLYKYNYKENNTLAEGKLLLGTSVTVLATGADPNRPAGSATIIVPQEIFPSTLYFPNATVDKAVALPVTWAPDPNNQYQKVSIEISYYKGISQAHQPGMPNSITSLAYEVADNGSFTIPQSDLENFPKGCYIGISIARAFYINSSGNIAYIGISEGHSVPILVTDSRNPIYGSIGSAVSTQGIGAFGYYSGDVNGDGYTDVIQPYSSGGTLALLVHDIAGPSTNLICNNVMSGSGTTSIGFAAGDFNGDGKSDFIQGWKNGTKLALSVFKSNGSSMSPLGSWTTNSGFGSIKLLPVDMDNDGYSDIAQLWNNNGKMGINIFRSTGSSYFTAWSGTFNEGSGNIALFPADYDGDGKTDIIQLWSNGGAVAYIVYRSTGSSYVVSAGGTFSEGIGNVGFAPVDYNADLKADFIQGWSNSGNMSIITYKSNGSSYASFNNSSTLESSASLALLPIRRAGDVRTGFVQVYNSANKTAFTRYWPYD